MSVELVSPTSSQRKTIEELARVHVTQGGAVDPSLAVKLVVGDATLSLELGDLVDLKVEQQRLQGELQEVGKHLRRLGERLADGQFTSKAPEEVVERERQRLSSLEERQAKVQELLTQLGG